MLPWGFFSVFTANRKPKSPARRNFATPSASSLKYPMQSQRYKRWSNVLSNLRINYFNTFTHPITTTASHDIRDEQRSTGLQAPRGPERVQGRRDTHSLVARLVEGCCCGWRHWVKHTAGLQLYGRRHRCNRERGEELKVHLNYETNYYVSCLGRPAYSLERVCDCHWLLVAGQRHQEDCWRSAIEWCHAAVWNQDQVDWVWNRVTCSQHESNWSVSRHECILLITISHDMNSLDDVKKRLQVSNDEYQASVEVCSIF